MGMRHPVSLAEAYEICRCITAKYAKTFYLGTMLMSEAKQRAIWAVYAWCRRTDELVDGIQADTTTDQTLVDWESQLEMAFQGDPSNAPDVALADTIKNYPIQIQPFKDMIAGMRMDLSCDRYDTFDDLHLYCYRVAGTVGLMSAAVMGFETADASVIATATEAAIALGIAMQLTNILRDIGEDAQRGRIYLPLEDLSYFDYTEKDLLNGVIDERWVELMRFQIQRAREFYAQAEQGISALCRDARWPVWASLMLYRNILSAIEKNHYEVFKRRAFVSTSNKVVTIPWAWLRAQI
ncbi:phytoene synthase [Tumidithrix elongata RA019]|uniref:15-cis-phytoene synthase n=2 Tax=Tumidithrix TaxID=3088355 RepID=A0AAW9Q2G1_9CYAN|nr:phytoene synthase [Tumidithrix elongata RA019]